MTFFLDGFPYLKTCLPFVSQDYFRLSTHCSKLMMMEKSKNYFASYSNLESCGRSAEDPILTQNAFSMFIFWQVDLHTEISLQWLESKLTLHVEESQKDWRWERNVRVAELGAGQAGMTVGWPEYTPGQVSVQTTANLTDKEKHLMLPLAFSSHDTYWQFLQSTSSSENCSGTPNCLRSSRYRERQFLSSFSCGRLSSMNWTSWAEKCACTSSRQILFSDTMPCMVGVVRPENKFSLCLA